MFPQLCCENLIKRLKKLFYQIPRHYTLRTTQNRLESLGFQGRLRCSVHISIEPLTKEYSQWGILYTVNFQFNGLGQKEKPLPDWEAVCMLGKNQLSVISRTSMGHTLTQMPQAMHLEAEAIPGSQTMTPKGQAALHLPQPMQSFLLIM